MYTKTAFIHPQGPNSRWGSPVFQIDESGKKHFFHWSHCSAPKKKGTNLLNVHYLLLHMYATFFPR